MKKIILLLCLILTRPAFASNQDAVFMFTPDTIKATKKDGKDVIDFALNQKLHNQFYALVDLFKTNGINVILAAGRPESPNVFNTNWFMLYSLNNKKSLIVLPQEDAHGSNFRPEYVKILLEKYDFKIDQINDYAFYREDKIFLDSSKIAFDRNYRHIYYINSLDSHVTNVIAAFSQNLKITYSSFKVKPDDTIKASQILNINERLAVMCKECFEGPAELKAIEEQLKSHNKEIIEITREQALANAADFIVLNVADKKLLFITDSAYNILTIEQRTKLEQYAKIIKTELSAFYEYDKSCFRDIVVVINN